MSWFFSPSYQLRVSCDGGCRTRCQCLVKLIFCTFSGRYIITTVLCLCLMALVSLTLEIIREPIVHKIRLLLHYFEVIIFLCFHFKTSQVLGAERGSTSPTNLQWVMMQGVTAFTNQIPSSKILYSDCIRKGVYRPTFMIVQLSTHVCSYSLS